MSEQTFKVLSNLVKRSLVRLVQIPQLDREIKELRGREELYAKAGFQSLAGNVNRQADMMEEEISQKTLVKQWREKGYLVIELDEFKKWHSRYDFYSTTIQENRFNNQLRRVLAIIPAQRYTGSVPDTVLETVVRFKEEHGLTEWDNGKFHVLTSGVLKDIKENVVKQLDPILLYKLSSGYSGAGYYAVVAWWGADIAEIEDALGLSHTDFPATTVFPHTKEASR